MHAVLIRAAAIQLVWAAIWLGLLGLPTAGAADVYEVVSKPTLAAGEPIPAPTGAVVLRIRGRIAAPDGSKEVAFDMATLERLGVVRFTTPTAWTDKPVTFDGVLLSSLLDLVGADSGATTLMMSALNDYQAPVPIEDARKWPVILALKENGTYMPVREHGPLWVVYPQHAYPELGGRDYVSRWVWQLASITVQ
jgi:hypothetical protein